MKRTIGVERTYPLGNYKNLKLHDYFSEVPDDFMFNDELVDNVRYLQFIQLEKDYRRYIELASRVGELKYEEAMELLENTKIDVLKEILEQIKNGEELDD